MGWKSESYLWVDKVSCLREVMRILSYYKTIRPIQPSVYYKQVLQLLSPAAFKCSGSLKLNVFWLAVKGVLKAFIQRLGYVYRVHCNVFILPKKKKKKKKHYFSHILPLFYTTFPFFKKTLFEFLVLPSEVCNGLRLISWPSVLWFANRLVHIVQKRYTSYHNR